MLPCPRQLRACSANPETTGLARGRTLRSAPCRHETTRGGPGHEAVPRAQNFETGLYRPGLSSECTEACGSSPRRLPSLAPPGAIIARNVLSADSYFRTLPGGRSLTQFLAGRGIRINYAPSIRNCAETNFVGGKEICIGPIAYR